MSVIAFIPARGGSKSIPGKNIKYFCDKPLIFWNLNELQESEVDQIIVATDSDEIKQIVNSFNLSKVKVFDRGIENYQDFSSTESVMLEYIQYADINEDDVFMLVQATSPFTQSNHFNEGLELFKNHDSVLSCSVSKNFISEFLSDDISLSPRSRIFAGEEGTCIKLFSNKFVLFIISIHFR